MMPIALNCRSILLPQRTGIGRYTYHLIDSLSRIDPDGCYILYSPRKFFDGKRKAPNPPGPGFKVREDFLNLGMGMTCQDAAVHHYPSPDMIAATRAKVVVSVHDLIYKTFPQGHTPKTLKFSEQKFKSIVARADRIICCSENTRRDLHRFFKYPESQSGVIYQGVDHATFSSLTGPALSRVKDFLKHKNIPENFILFVGTIEPRKNLVNLLKALAVLKTKNGFRGKLVVAGMVGWMTEGIAALAAELNLQEDIVFLGFVTDEELVCLYNTTSVFVFPSFYEGFGFPIIEAMSCGAPVVTSQASSCGEVAGGAALTIDPASPEDIASAIHRVLVEPKLRESLRQNGFRRSQDFSFEKTARETLAVYKQL